MKQFKHMTANWLNARSRPAMPARNNLRWAGGCASFGNALQNGRSFAPGGAR